LGVELPLPSFFNHPTLSNMADTIDTIRWASQQESASSPNTDGQREKFEI